MPPLLLHIGYHKTGTTWLQNVLFKPKYGYQSLLDLEEIHVLLERPHALTFDADAARAAIAARQGLAPGKVEVISSESLSGTPWFGGRESVIYAERLKAVAPDARILITIREQKRILTSIYMQYLKNYGSLSPKQFFQDTAQRDVYDFSSEYYEYHRLIDHYRKLFGPGNVHVGTQEALARDPVAYAQELARFSGAVAEYDREGLIEAENVSYPEHCAPIIRRINKFQRGPIGREALIDLGPVAKIAYRGVGWVANRWPLKRYLNRFKPVSGYVRGHFAGRYAESNRKLKEMLGDQIDLKGYEM